MFFIFIDIFVYIVPFIISWAAFKEEVHVCALVHMCAMCCVVAYVCTYVQEVATADIAFHFDVLFIDNNCYPSSTESAASIDICCYFG